MTKSTWHKTAFNGGELSPFLDGRVDYEKYASGAKEMVNWIPTVYGPMTRRPGTHFVYDLGTDKPLFLPFVFNETQSYVMCFTDYKLRLFTNDGIMTEQDDDTTVFELTTPYGVDDLPNIKTAQSGDVVYVAHPSYPVYKISRTDTNTFTIAEVTFVDGPFLDDNTDSDSTIAVTGSANTVGTSVTLTSSEDLFTEDSVGRLVKIAYYPEASMDTWEATSHDFAGNYITYSSGDYLTYEDNVYEVTGYDSTNASSLPTYTGTWSPLHTSGTESDGRLKLKFVGTSYGYVKITAYTSATEVTATIVRALPIGYVTTGGTVSTDYWALGAFSEESGYPYSVIFHQQRLVFGGTANNPQSIFGSTLDDIENFERTTDEDDSESYFFTLAATKRNLICWMKSANNKLYVGTIGSEFIVSSSSSAITPTDVSVTPTSTYGSKRTCDAIASNGFILFPQVGGKKLRQMTYDYNTDRYYAVDLNKVSEHLTYDGIDQMTEQNEPYQLIWVLVDGMLRCLTYETEEKVFAWHRHDLSGGVDGDGEVVTICSIPNDSLDRLWLCVVRNGEYYVEYLEEYFHRTDDLTDAWFVDSGLEYSGDATTTISGLDHLIGYTVAILADGHVNPEKVVDSNGEITLDYEAEHVIVGLPYTSYYQSMRLEGGSQSQVGQGKSKRIVNTILRMDAAGAGTYYGLGALELGEAEISPNLTDLELVLTRTTQDTMNEPPDLIFGDTAKMPGVGGWSSQYMYRIEHRLPTPCTIIGILAEVITNE